MKYTQSPKILIILGSLLIMSGCSIKKIPSSNGGFYHHNLYFGSNFTEEYKKGIIQGCKTATGVYTKSHGLFKDSHDYKDGWFLGRNRCRRFLKIDKNGDLIL